MAADNFTDNTGNGVARDDVLQALSHLLASDAFQASQRNRRFLSYVVEEALAGRGHRIKSYTIAVDVFGRPANFDSVSDPIVRIEASRLRAGLAKYYSTAGSADTIQILLPPGSYEPKFRRVGQPAAPDPGEPPAPEGSASPPRSLAGTLRRYRVVLGLAGLLAVAAVGWALYQTLWPPLSVRPTIVIEKPVQDANDTRTQLIADGLKEALITTLSRYDGLGVTATTGQLQTTEIVARRQQLGGAVYILESSVGTAEDRLRFSWRLVSATDGSVLWLDRIEERLTDAVAISVEERIAGGIALTLASDRGIIVRSEMTADARRSVPGYECLLQGYAYVRSLSAATHARARDCLEATVAANPDDAEAWALLSYVYTDESRNGFNPRGDLDSIRARALAASDRALALAPGSSLVHQMRSVVLFDRGDYAGFERAAKRSIELNPTNARRLVVFGNRLYALGRFVEGAALVQRGIDLSPFPTPVDYLTPVFESYRLGDCNAATAQAEHLGGDATYYLVPLIAAAIYGGCGDKVAAAANVSKLLKLRPDYAKSFRDDWRNRHYRDEMIDKLADGLRKAGLAVE